MSIKFKIPLMMVLVFITNIVLLFLCYRFYIAGRMTQSLRDLQESTAVFSSGLAAEINGKSRGDAESRLSGLAAQNDMTFLLLDAGSGEKTEIGPAGGTKVGAASVEPVTIDGRPYILYVQKNIDLYDLRSKSAIRDVLYFECVIMFFMLLLTELALHFRYVRPLMRLKSTIRQYDAEKPPAVLPAYKKDEIGQLEESFSVLARSLSDEKRIQKRIIASISHDIKTPLTSVMGYAERLIRRNIDAEKRKQYLKTIYSQAKDIEAIVSEFDEYLGTNSEIRLDLRPYETAFVCKMLSDEYVQQLSESGIQISVENSCGARSKIAADMPKLRRVFANIIGNSIRHGNAEKLSIVMKAEEMDGVVRFTISDNGQGVPESELPFIFEPFYTSDKSRRVSGLGLSICQSIVCAHGGNISASHSQAGGLSILIKLPKVKPGYETAS